VERPTAPARGIRRACTAPTTGGQAFSMGGGRPRRSARKPHVNVKGGLETTANCSGRWNASWWKRPEAPHGTTPPKKQGQREVQLLNRKMWVIESWYEGIAAGEARGGRKMILTGANGGNRGRSSHDMWRSSHRVAIPNGRARRPRRAGGSNPSCRMGGPAPTACCPVSVAARSRRSRATVYDRSPPDAPVGRDLWDRPPGRPTRARPMNTVLACHAIARRETAGRPDLGFRISVNTHPLWPLPACACMHADR
jgi:hypothetical protein